MHLFFIKFESILLYYYNISKALQGKFKQVSNKEQKLLQYTIKNLLYKESYFEILFLIKSH